MRPITVVAPSVWAPMWGVAMTLGRASSGLSPPGGSAAKASRAAPRSRPLASASSSAASSTSSPRAVLTSAAPGFMRARKAASTMPRVAGVTGAWSDTKSLVASNSSSPAARTPKAAAVASFSSGS